VHDNGLADPAEAMAGNLRQIPLCVVLKGDNPWKEIAIKSWHFISGPICSLHWTLTSILATLTGYLFYQYIFLSSNTKNSPQDEDHQSSLLLVRAIIASYTLLGWLASVVVTGRWMQVLGPERIMALEHEMEQKSFLDWKPPPSWIFKYFWQDHFFRPVAVGLENIPTEYPCWYVSNHSLHGLEMFSYFRVMGERRGVYPRGLAEHAHFAWCFGDMLKFFGAVDGTRANARCLMEAGENILVYPGGGREMWRHSSLPKYSLLWEGRSGFVRLAIEYGYPILPCASVGVEEMLDVLFDVPLGYFRKGVSLPVILPFISPFRLQRLYFWFGEPIPTKQYNGDWKNEENVKEVHKKVRDAVAQGIKKLQEQQAKDPDRYYWKYLLNYIGQATTMLRKQSCTSS
jgi:1-acyl-sn-glycerol-3-phosphate acyltransferase